MLLRFLLSDPVMHWGVFAVLSGILCFRFYHSGMNLIQLGKVILLGIGYLLFIEIYQTILPWPPQQRDHRLRRDRQAVIKVILLGIGYVLFIEIYQAILPWRSFGFDDILWGCVGVVSVVILFFSLNR